MSFVGDFQSSPEEVSTTQNNSLFIWLDVLGFAEAVDDVEKYRELSELLKKFQALFVESDKYDTKIISDGLILYAKEPTEEMISLIFKEIAEKQFEFILKNKYFIRGGIAVGSRYESDEVTDQFISNGLARAYSLESSGIDWPLIATDEKNIQRIRCMFNMNGNNEYFGLEKAYNKNGKTIYFIDFIKENERYLKLLEKKIFEFKKEPSVRNKYVWLLRYYLHRYENSRKNIDESLKGIVL
jgi:hypothetical protein